MSCWSSLGGSLLGDVGTLSGSKTLDTCSLASSGMVTLHAGYIGHPQNRVPSARFLLMTMAGPHTGHRGLATPPNGLFSSLRGMCVGVLGAGDILTLSASAYACARIVLAGVEVLVAGRAVVEIAGGVQARSRRMRSSFVPS